MSAADYSAKKSIVIITTTGSSNAVGNGVDDDAISKWRRYEGGVGEGGGRGVSPSTKPVKERSDELI